MKCYHEFFLREIYVYFTGINSPIDLIIALDTTKGVNSGTLFEVKELLKALLRSYNITQSGTNVGLLTYGNNAHEIVPIRDGIVRTLVESNIDKAVYMNGPRRVEDVLSKALSMLRYPSNSDHRSETSKQILLILLDGIIDVAPASVAQLASQIKLHDIRPIVLAVNVSNAQALLSIVKNKADFYTVDEGTSLGNVLGEIEKRSAINAGTNLYQA